MEFKKCIACEEIFNWDDDVLSVDGEVYHENCVDLYPMGYYAMIGEEPIGEVEDYNYMAFEILEDGEYIEDADL